MKPSKAKQHVKRLEKILEKMKCDLDKEERETGNMKGRQFSRFQIAKEAYRKIEDAIAILRAIG